jgi:hypothetical protein
VIHRKKDVKRFPLREKDQRALRSSSIAMQCTCIASGSPRLMVPLLFLSAIACSKSANIDPYFSSWHDPHDGNG